MNQSKYVGFIYIYVSNYWLTLIATEEKMKININSIIILLILTSVTNFLNFTPVDFYSPVFKDSGFLSDTYYSRTIGFWGNPNLTAFIIGIFSFTCIANSKNRVVLFVSYISQILSAFTNISRTMMVSSMIVVLRNKFKLGIFLGLTVFMYLIYHGFLIDNNVFITRLFSDFDSLSERIEVYDNVINNVNVEFFDSDISALSYSFGYGGLLFPITALLYSFYKKNLLILFISISGLTGYGFCSGYLTPLLTMIILSKVDWNY
ncbi:hypothetical protein ICV01_01625 [Polynucleobacter sp. MWH-Spelu-300-X4]|uniref:hypothetical protein n=1 Tax=Polynucleobacter sp. MWH-Spelu-300-X4 TaxID=2689109 RepID=UPI001BFDE3FC|nr:hypothetical protein [Polynucleobacter sp. MWH-Spelu-300-X4]QWD80044.1 hypothetical protein ICV01_01625 [Polynucleobacter sp. MWH-Spelu-300-X4]